MMKPLATLIFYYCLSPFTMHTFISYLIVATRLTETPQARIEVANGPSESWPAIGKSSMIAS